MSKLTAIALALFIATTAVATSPQPPTPPQQPTPQQIDPYTGGLKPLTGPPVCPPSNPNCTF